MTNSSAATHPQKLTWKVDGMDCGSCASTIRTSLEKLSGVSDIKISVTRESLSLVLDETATTAATIEARVRKLGFEPSLQTDKRSLQPAHSEECGCGHDHDQQQRPLLNLASAFGDPPISLDKHEHHNHAGGCCGHDHTGESHGQEQPAGIGDHAHADEKSSPKHDACGCGHDHSDHDHGKSDQAAGARHDHHRHHDHGHAHPHDHSHGEKADACGCGHDHAHDHGEERPAATALARIGTEAGLLSWKVGGMDCGSCAATIRTALEKTSGISDVKISLATETLSLRLNEGVASAGTVDALLSRLGYSPTRLSPATTTPMAAAPPKAEPPPRRWWQTAKGRVAIAAGVLLGAAYTAGHFVPEASFAVFLLATLVAIAPISKRAFMAAFAGAPFTIEMLLTIAAGGALFIGAMEEAALVVFLFAVGEVLEGVAANKARSGIRALAALVPKTAWLEQAGELREVAADSLRLGQTVMVRPGDRVPADGSVISGISSVDESPITGESIPKSKEPGARIFAGSINREAALRVRVEREPEDNTIARIVALVEEAQDAKAPTERFIDRFSRIYMPVIVGLSLLVAVVPPLAVGAEWSVWIYRALTLLLIGCPCALVISVPAAIASSLSMAARRGLLVKGGVIVEALAGTRIVAFDKTGTLTWGRPVVTDVVAGATDKRRLLALAAAVERESSHPLAEAIVARARDEGATAMAASSTKAVPGKGMEARLGEVPLFIGAPRFAAERVAIPTGITEQVGLLEGQGKTVALVVEGREIAGVIALRDEPRPDARTAIADLKAMGVRAVMLTGDNRRTGEAIGRQLGIEVQAEMMPEAKVEAVRRLGREGKVIMVGDGINDAPALAAATAGIAMGSGTDVAFEAADAALLKSRVGDVVRLISLSRATMANIRQNIAIALGLKLFFLATTVAGMTGLWIAVLADTGATVLVTMNALRLLGFFRDDEAPQSRKDLTAQVA